MPMKYIVVIASIAFATTPTKAETIYAYPTGAGQYYASQKDGSTTYFYPDGSGALYGSNNGHTIYLYPDGSGTHYGSDSQSHTNYYTTR